MSNPINDVMNTSMSGIKNMVDVNTVIGDAVQTPDGSVIIPVCKVCFAILFLSMKCNKEKLLVMRVVNDLQIKNL